MQSKHPRRTAAQQQMVLDEIHGSRATVTLSMSEEVKAYLRNAVAGVCASWKSEGASEVECDQIAAEKVAIIERGDDPDLHSGWPAKPAPAIVYGTSPVDLNAELDKAVGANPELFSAPADPMAEALERARLANARLLHKDDDINPQAPSDWDMDGQGVVEAMPAASNVPPEIAALLDDGETLTRDVRRKLTERLNVELAELKNLRGLAGEDLKREAEIEKLLGLFARLGEI